MARYIDHVTTKAQNEESGGGSSAGGVSINTVTDGVISTGMSSTTAFSSSVGDGGGSASAVTIGQALLSLYSYILAHVSS